MKQIASRALYKLFATKITLSDHALLLIAYSIIGAFMAVYVYCFCHTLDMFNHKVVKPEHVGYGFAWWQMTKRKVMPFVRRKIFVKR